jgi:hypothetical protein
MTVNVRNQRPLGIPTVRDRVAQLATTIVLEPIFEADFRGSSYGFRPKHSATQTLKRLRVCRARGGVTTCWTWTSAITLAASITLFHYPTGRS